MSDMRSVCFADGVKFYFIKNQQGHLNFSCDWRWLGHLSYFLVLFTALTLFSSSAGQTQSQKQVFKVAIDSEFAPYEFVDPAGNTIGFTVSLLDEIGHATGFLFQFKPMAWPDAVKALENGEVDLVNMIHSPLRAEQFLFSQPHTSVAQAIFKNSTFSDSDQSENLEGHRVAFQENDISLEILANNSDFESILVNSKKEGFSKLNSGEVDFFFVAEQPGIWLLDKERFEDVQIISWGLFPQNYCFAARPDNAELIALLNNELQTLKDSGKYDKLVNQWLKVNPGDSGLKRHVREILGIALGLALVAFALGMGILLLRKRVEGRTRDLIEANNLIKLQASSLLNLIAHFPDGILHENADRKIYQVNQRLIDLFSISLPIEKLVGEDCRQVAQQVKTLFEDGDRFVERIEEIVTTGQAVSNEELQLVDGRTFERDYVSIQVLGRGMEHLWHYRDITLRKRTEIQLEESSQLFENRTLQKRAILESPQRIIIFALDKNYCYMDFTQQHKDMMKAIWGVDIELGSNILDCITDEGDRAKAKQNFDRAFNGERFIVSEAVGDEELNRTYYENWYSPVTDVNEQIIGVSIYVIDISDRMRAEAQREEALSALQKSEEKYRLIVENAHDGIEISQNEYIIFTNIQFANILGYTVDELKNTKFSQLFSPAALVELEERGKARKAGIPLPNSYETTFLKKDGSSIVVEVNYEIIEYNGRPATFAIIRDISERKLAEEARRRQLLRRERTGAVLSNISVNPNLISGAVAELVHDLNVAATEALGVERVGVWLFEDDTSKLKCIDTYLAGSAEHIQGDYLHEHEFQAEFAALKNEKYVDANDPHTDPRTAGYIESYLAPNEISSMLDAVVRLEGKVLGTLRFERVKQPHQWEDDEIAFACQLADQVALAIAIREQKAAESALRQSHQKLEKALFDLEQAQEQLVQQERLSAVGQLAAGIAHDFNNILTSISGFTELTQMAPDISPAVSANLEKIISASQRAANLVRQLLDFSRKTIRNPKRFDLAETIREAANFFDRAIPENIKIVLTVAPGEFTVKADPTQIQQVITNLVINARDAMPNGGELSLELDHLEAEETLTCVACGLPMAGTWLTITVKDSGEGISPEVLPHIFEPFFTTKPVGEGTGLGLSQVFGIINQHDGHITIASEIGKGTTFKVYLPTSERLDGVIETPPQPDLKHGHGETILIVEDESIVLDACRSVLEHLGYRTLTTESGREALAIYQAQKNDIAMVITDMVMPDMDGSALFMALKAETPGIKVVLMSGYPLNENGKELLEMGVVAWLEKPISFKQLSNVVSNALSVKQGRWSKPY